MKLAACFVPFGVALADVSTGQRQEPPEPLTLAFALSRIDGSHPTLKSIEAQYQQAESELFEARARTGWRFYAQARLRYVDPPGFSQDDSRDDHRAALIVDKTLHDFGRTRSRIEAAKSARAEKQLLYDVGQRERRIDLLKKYFAVILADQEFAVQNEQMSVAFIALDEIRNKGELGGLSDLDVKEQEAIFRKAQRLRTQAQNVQRAARARLAYALNMPGKLPDRVSVPENLPHLQRGYPGVEELQAKALSASSEIKALRERLEAARYNLEAARAEDNPVLEGQAELNSYSRQSPNYDKWRMSVTLTIPLSTGGQTQAVVAGVQAEKYRLEAELLNLEEETQQRVLELCLELDMLKVQKAELETENEFRQLSLDKSRTLYEMEVTADLGDAMVLTTDVERRAMETDFAIVLAWEELDLLTGMSAQSLVNNQ